MEAALAASVATQQEETEAMAGKPTLAQCRRQVRFADAAGILLVRMCSEMGATLAMEEAQLA